MLKVKFSNPSLIFLVFLTKKLESFGVDFYLKIQEQALLVRPTFTFSKILEIQRKF